MPEPDLLRLFALPLESANIEYIITGSIALVLYAEPRLTHDIDIVVHLNFKNITRIPMLFPEKEYYCPPEEILIDEMKKDDRAQFNIIHHDSGFKADFFLFGNDPLHEWAFANKRRMQIDEEYSLWLAPPEYVIIRKMQYFAEGGSDKHLRDIQNMVSVMQDRLDSRFIEMQASNLKLIHVWQRVLSKPNQ